MPYTLKKRDRIIASINHRVIKSDHKFGIKIPRNIKEALKLDQENGNSLWKDTYKKEMFQVSIVFNIFCDNEQILVGYNKASGHLIWSVKMDFTRKARWVKDVHRTPDLEDSNYAGLVSHESVRIAITYAALHGIEVLAADTRNAYLQAPKSEKHYIICGEEFGLENI